MLQAVRLSILFATAGRQNDMFWKRRKPAWFIDPSNVAFGSVFENGSRNLSRSHVRVKYHQGSEARFIPLATFVQRCRGLIRARRSLDIEHLLVAPILKRRYARFFDRLTDWGPATCRASGLRPKQKRPMSHDR